MSLAALPVTYVDGQVLPAADLNSNFAALNTAVVGPVNGGTGLTGTPTNGQLAIGNGTGFTLHTLTAGAHATVTNGAGTITIDVAGVVTNAPASDTGVFIQYGTITAAGGLAVTATAAVTFNTAFPTAILSVVVTGHGEGVGGTTVGLWTASGITLAGFTASVTTNDGVTNLSNVNYTAHYIAVGK